MNQTLTQLKADIEDQMRQMVQAPIPLIQNLTDYILFSGGKRIRPLLTILLGQSLGGDKEKLLRLAVAVEILHCASLVHDDVIDQSTMRRGKPTVIQGWSSDHAILIGDYLHAQSFEILASLDMPILLSELANTAKSLTRAELFQLDLQGQLDINLDQYLQIIDGKTASLFRFCLTAAGIVADTSPRNLDWLQQLGTSLGFIFQFTDDWLDFDDTEQLLGKNLGDDLQRGRITLPIILAFSKGAEREKLTRLLTQVQEIPDMQATGEQKQQQMTDLLSEILRLIKEDAVVHGFQGLLDREIDTVRQITQKIPEGLEKKALKELVSSFIDRWK